jgi:2-dehydropantoate 2-reductase
MLADILRKKPTEIDAINGAIVRQAQSLGIKTPVNALLVDLVKTIESNYTQEVKA